VGLVQVVLKDAWLTVLDGYRPGRQHILSQPVTSLGRADHLPLAFIGPMNQNVEPIHCRIVRQPNGQYTVEDNQSQLGLSVNHAPVKEPRPLRDGDVIKIGTNFVRFNERRKAAGAPALAEGNSSQAAVKTPPAPPPPPPAKSKPPASSPGSAVPVMPKPPATTMPPVKSATAGKGAAPPARSILPPPPPPPPRKS
jgi:pSer/pThr/pTyr-binding forkhead associated (FHA) protein